MIRRTGVYAYAMYVTVIHLHYTCKWCRITNITRAVPRSGKEAILNDIYVVVLLLHSLLGRNAYNFCM